MKYVRADKLKAGDKIFDEGGSATVTRVTFAKHPVFVLGGTFGQKSIRIDTSNQATCYVAPSLEIAVAE